MEGHRRYAEGSEPSWYNGQDSYPAGAQPGSRDPYGQTTNAYDSGVHERPDAPFRLPDQRPAENSYGHTVPPPESSEAARISPRGTEFPTIRPTGAGDQSQPSVTAATTYGGGPTTRTTTTTETTVSPVSPGLSEETGLVPGLGAPDRRDSVYRIRRPISAIVLAVVTAVLTVPAVVLLIDAVFDSNRAAGQVVPAVLLTLGLPLTGFGLYSVAAGGQTGREAWLRPPIAYLPVGLIVLLAAGLAAA